jgi:hypothetical protein
LAETQAVTKVCTALWLLNNKIEFDNQRCF